MKLSECQDCFGRDTWLRRYKVHEAMIEVAACPQHPRFLTLLGGEQAHRFFTTAAKYNVNGYHQVIGNITHHTVTGRFLVYGVFSTIGYFVRKLDTIMKEREYDITRGRVDADTRITEQVVEDLDHLVGTLHSVAYECSCGYHRNIITTEPVLSQPIHPKHPTLGGGTSKSVDSWMMALTNTTPF